jgi:alanyl aminopeptidase
MDARRVLPCFDEPDRKATWKLTLTVPAHMRAFANMPVESERAADAGWREVAFQRSPRLPSYLLAFAVGEFESVDGGRAGMNNTPVSIIVPKGRAAEARYAAANTGPILAAAEQFFGVPYPFPKLDLLAYPRGFFGAALENPGLITYVARYLLARPEEVNPVFEQRFAGITAHEISHMWFGDYVTMAWWNDLWLNESFASWLGTRIVMEMHPQWPSGWRSLQRTKAIEFDQLRPRGGCASRSPTSAKCARRSTASRMRKARRSSPCSSSGWGGEVSRGRAPLCREARVVQRHGRRLLRSPCRERRGDRSCVPRLCGSPRRPAPRHRTRLQGRARARDRATPLRSRRRRRERIRAVDVPCLFRTWETARARVKVCTVVRDVKQTVALPAGACPQWVVANRKGTGYYLPRLSPALYDALPKADRVLTGADYEPLLGDLTILARAGAVRYDVALRVAARQAKSGDTRTARRAYALAGAVPDALVDAPNKPRYAAWIRRDLRRPCAHARLAAAERRHRGGPSLARAGRQGRRHPGRRCGTRPQGAAARAALGRASQRHPARARRLILVRPRARRTRTRQALRRAVRVAATTRTPTSARTRIVRSAHSRTRR